MQRIPSIWVCFTTQGVIQNGSVFRYQTPTSGRLYIGVAPPPPTGTDAGYLEIIYSLKKGKGECECVCVGGGGAQVHCNKLLFIYNKPDCKYTVLIAVGECTAMSTVK